MLIVKNYQSHENTELPIEEGKINVIRGDSRAGKSAVFRALESLCLNEPVECRDNSNKTTVSWRGVDRVKSTSENKYVIDGGQYKAVRTSVPRQVSDKLRLGEINFRPQHTAYFLLQESSGSVARSMNELTDLGVIDYVASKLKSDEADAKAHADSIATSIEIKTTQLAALDWVDDADAALANVEELEAEASKIEAEIATISPLVSDAEKTHRRLQAIPESSRGDVEMAIASLDKTELSALQELLFEIESVDYTKLNMNFKEDLEECCASPSLSTVELSKLSDLLNEIEATECDLHDCPDIAGDIEVISGLSLRVDNGLSELLDSLEDIKMAPNSSKDIDKINESLKRMRTDSFEATLRSIEAATASLNSLGIKAEEASTNLKKALENLKVCPLCDQSTCRHGERGDEDSVDR